MRLSKNVTYKEAVRSSAADRLGISNEPSPLQLANMLLLCEEVFEPCREHFGVPIVINSMYRSEAVNEAIGGSKTSQHCKGEAMDIRFLSGTINNANLFYFIKDNLEFDQLIWEFGNDVEPSWVHVSYSKPNRKQVLKAKRIDGRVVYNTFF